MEQIDLTSPEIKPSNTYYRVERLTLDWPAKAIYVQLKGTNGEAKSFSYSGDIAQILMIALNTANLSIKSLHRRIMERLVTDGLIDGTISGAVD